MKNSIKLCIVILFIAFISCEKEPIEDVIITSETFFKSSNNLAKGGNNSTVDVFSPILNKVMGAATLHRSNKGITVNYRTTGLTKNYCYTLWLVAWNNPQKCIVPGDCSGSDFERADQVQVEVMYAGGHVVRGNGPINFSAHLKVDDNSGSSNALFGLPSAGGLQSGKVMTAQIFAVIRSHGPAVPGKINEQIGSYSGGCLDPLAIAPFTEIPDEVGECGDIELANFRIVN